MNQSSSDNNPPSEPTRNSSATSDWKDDSNATEAPTLDFDQMSLGGNRVFIYLENTKYELKRTRSGRLVLHK